jgi:hypothetical protein
MELYKISEQIRNLLSQETDDGELPPSVAEQLGKTEQQFNERCEDIAAYRAELLAQAEGIKKEAERLAAWQGRLERKAEFLKSYVQNQMEGVGVQKIEGKLFKLRIQNNSRPSIAVKAGCEIPERFKRVKVELDGNLAWERWKAGEELPESLDVKLGSHLRVQ